jgi:hypothetical protein
MFFIIVCFMKLAVFSAAVNARQGSTLKLPYSRPVVPLFFLQC